MEKVVKIHPTLLCFGKTKEQQFPLALIIGREPNTDMSIGNCAGAYDFRDYPRAGFWNIAYSLMAEAANLQGRTLKAISVKCESSPILFGNSLPLGLKNKVVDKRSFRKAVEPEATRHIRNLFAFDELIKRVELVVISGLEREEFSASCKAIEGECRNWSLPLIRLPFFFGRNKPRINQELTEGDRARMKAVTMAFLEHSALVC